ncbi:MAG: NosD domain-containing protein [Candidatus Thermoplasmatota archaeon]|nr:NosD domain-containing protein [Candidatus Thermoplasmatota archaeon]
MRASKALHIILVMGLLLGTLALEPHNSAQASSIYVGGSGAGNHTTIAAALAAASNGDTIFIYNGNYAEQVVVNKEVSIMGESQDVVVGHANAEYAFRITASNVTLSNFRAEVVSDSTGYGIHLLGVNNIEMKSVNASKSRNGILVENSANIRVLNSIFTANHAGIILHHSQNVRFEHCEIGRSFNPALKIEGGESITISNSTFDYSQSSSVVLVNGSNRLLFENNHVVGRRQNTVFPGLAGLQISNSHMAVIRNNNFTNNYMGGMELSQCQGAEITDNEFHGNGMAGLLLHMYCNHTNIRGNLFISNRFGLNISLSWNVDVDGNHIVGNAVDGLGLVESSQSTIYSNTIEENPWGMYVGGSEGNSIYGNIFLNNTKGHAWDNGTNQWNAAYPICGNHWGGFEAWDNLSGPEQKWLWPDNVADTQYSILGGNSSDRYPILDPELWVDVRPPALAAISLSPAQGEFNVSSNHTVEVVFNQPMDTYASPTITQTTGTTATYTFVGWDTTTYPRDTARWTHSGWSDNERITISITGARGEYGVATPDFQLEWWFETADDIPPIVWGYTPTRNADSVRPNQVVRLYFNERMDSEQPPSLIQTQGTPVSYTFNGWISLYTENDVAEWIHSPWLEGENITLMITDMFDLAGNPVAENITWSFTVGVYPPRVISKTPLTTASRDQDVVVIFDETLDISRIPQIIQTDGDPVAYAFQGFNTTNVLNDTVSWSHGNWTDGQKITISISGYHDIYDNTDQYSWSFRVFRDAIPPTARAGPDIYADTYTLVVLNGSLSTDNVAIISHRWEFKDRGVKVVLNGELASYRFPIPGQYLVNLTVTDFGLNTDSDSLLVNIVAGSISGTVSGRLVDVNGNPISQANVTFISGEESITAESDDDGLFEAILPPGSFFWKAETHNLTAEGSGSLAHRGTVNLGNVTMAFKPIPIEGEDGDKSPIPLLMLVTANIVLGAFAFHLFLQKKRRGVFTKK